MELEKDVELPLKYIDSALPDGCRGYSIGSIYGISRSFWEEDCVIIKKEVAA